MLAQYQTVTTHATWCTLYMFKCIPLYQCTDTGLISRSDTSTNVHCVTAQCIAPSWNDFTENKLHCTKLLESKEYNPNDWVYHYHLNLIITLPWRIRSKCRLHCVSYDCVVPSIRGDTQAYLAITSTPLPCHNTQNCATLHSNSSWSR